MKKLIAVFTFLLMPALAGAGEFKASDFNFTKPDLKSDAFRLVTKPKQKARAKKVASAPKQESQYDKDGWSYELDNGWLYNKNTEWYYNPQTKEWFSFKAQAQTQLQQTYYQPVVQPQTYVPQQFYYQPNFSYPSMNMNGGFRSGGGGRFFGGFRGGGGNCSGGG
jgi:uncharacterized membrane protein YgcG